MGAADVVEGDKGTLDELTGEDKLKLLCAEVGGTCTKTDLLFGKHPEPLQLFPLGP
jgi:hypothetical protein